MQHRIQLLCGLAILLLMGCEDNSTANEQDPSGTEECQTSEVKCGETCVNLENMHWTSCGTCAEGYKDADSNAENGCETEFTDDSNGDENGNGNENDDTTPEDCAKDEVKCGETCVKLSEMNWSSCDTCAEGYVDADGVASNGCESAASGGCDENTVLCGETCVNLSEMNWSSCETCAEGFEDKDGNAENGCEVESSPENPPAGCTDGLTPCGEACVNLAELHWTSCGTCAEGFEDKDGNAENGCELDLSIPLECPENQVQCGSDCINLAEKHWSTCNTCAEWYVDADNNAENGCEVSNPPSGKCHTDEQCIGFLNVESAECQSNACVITSCHEGYADCDKDVLNGCEVNGNKDFYRCGAKGLCTSEEEKGNRCKLGEQCANGTCAPVPEIVGCSDGTREGFTDLIRFNNLAACGGAWTVPGIHHNVPACERKSGNTGTNSAGTGCNLEDLCAEGWHVCLGRGDVMTRSDYGCDGILDGVNANEPALFITRTSSTGSLQCDPDTVGVPLNMNDIFGCGNFGCYATGSECDPLKLSSHNLCDALRNSCGCKRNTNGTVTCSNTSGYCAGNGIGHSIDYFSALNGKTYAPAWDCGKDSSGLQEARDIVKSLPDQQGGVMCCKDQCQADADCGAGLICRYHVCVECIRKADGTYEGCPAGKTCTQQHTCE